MSYFLISLTVCIADLLGGTVWKPARRYVIPALIVLAYPSPLMLFQAVLLSVVLSLNLDEIENKNWGAVFCKGIAIAFCLFPICGYYGMMLANTWLFTTWWSNNYFLGMKLDWKLAEVTRLSPIGLCIWLQQNYPI